MTNEEVRKLIKQSRFFNYEIAGSIGISEVTFSQWFRKELTPDQVEKILKAVEDLKEVN